MTRSAFAAAAALALGLTACKKEEPLPLYEAVPVAARDIIVAAEAAGTIEPILVVEVKSKASGEIMALNAETGDIVQRGEVLVQVDPRDPRNSVTQAQADTAVARAQLANAEAQKRRADDLIRAQLISEQEHEAAVLAFANARAALVRAERNLQLAEIQLQDTEVRAPIGGTVIEKTVERGQVIASATSQVSGGTTLLRLADLSTVQVRTLVDETDIGKIQPGMRASITVDAYPQRPFTGTVLKIEPQSTVQQNVTMFPVLIQIGNEQGLLRPGMSAQVSLQVAERRGVLSIPNSALRTQRDVASAAQVLGLNPEEVTATLARADSARPQGQASLGGTAGNGGSATGDRRPEGPATGDRTPATGDRRPATGMVAPQVAAVPEQPVPGSRSPVAGQGFQLPEGVTQEMAAEIRRKRQAGEALTPAESTASARMREAFQRMREQGGMQGMGGPGGQGAPVAGGPSPVAGQPAGGGDAGQGGGGPQLPPGITMEMVRPIFQKMQSGQQLTPQEQAIMSRMRASMGGGNRGGRQRFGAGNNFQFGGSYIVFVLRDGAPTPVRIRTGVTDMDYSEVASGLTAQDTVLLLPSASLIQSQQEMRERFRRMTGGGGVPGMQQQQAPATRPATQGGAPGGAGR